MYINKENHRKMTPREQNAKAGTTTKARMMNGIVFRCMKKQSKWRKCGHDRLLRDLNMLYERGEGGLHVALGVLPRKYPQDSTNRMNKEPLAHIFGG